MTFDLSSLPPVGAAKGKKQWEPRFRAADQAVVLEWDSLKRYLQLHGHSLNCEVRPQQFAGGLGNLNYLIQVDGSLCVLRRPPLGVIPPGANDMARESRVLTRLWEQYKYAPKSLLYCAEPSVIGAHFLIMEYRPGLTIGGVLPDEMASRDVGPKLAAMLVELLSDLHRVAPESVGLEGLGKPEGFLARASDGWYKRACLATNDKPRRIIKELHEWLEANRPLDGQQALLHCDFKLDNVVLDPESLAPQAVLDWDMATRGDPLFDLATLLSYWTEVNDPQSMHELRQMPTGLPGFPSRRDIVAAYAHASGRDVSNFLFYRVLAMFKLGVVFLQLYARYRAGATLDNRFEGFERLGYGILEFTHDIASGRAF